MTFRAVAYGLRLACDDPIPGLTNWPESKNDPPVDFRVNLGSTPAWRIPLQLRYEHPVKDVHGIPLLCCNETGRGHITLEYSDGVRFYLDLNTSVVWVTWSETGSREYAAAYLLGPVLGFLLRLRGHVCLHASAVVIRGHCIAFIGPSGAGKSTLAAAFARRGTEVLTEDVASLLPCTDGFWIQPGYPLIRLWDESAEFLNTEAEQLPLLSIGWKKRCLALDGEQHRFYERVARLSALYILADRRPMPWPAEIRELPGRAILEQLVANTYSNYLLDRGMRAHEFGVLGTLARTVPVRELTLHEDGARLFEACDWIETQVQQWPT